MRTYIITNDKYCQEQIDTTFEELKEYCRDNGWSVELKESASSRGFMIVDHNKEIVAEEIVEISK